ncbi:hypothetical protein BURPSPAST_E0144 [Burkholderia pseudomallei Pasteur 52237]|nr:hypothetical protein BURPSPAST_E0144 [Burkholderia pseudomallei Pasteur 52237]
MEGDGERELHAGQIEGRKSGFHASRPKLTTPAGGAAGGPCAAPARPRP